MVLFLICSVAFLASGLTFFSGFGLGTLLMPVFGLFFPMDIAVAMTAIVHFLNNVFKLIMVGRFANREVIWLFGTPSVIAAILGAFFLNKLNQMPTLYEWAWQKNTYTIAFDKCIIGVLLLVFALWEVIPMLKNLSFSKKYLPIGGFLSGFLGGLSGLQGALRSAFLSKLGLTKESFIATGVIIACLVDLSRLSVYAQSWARHYKELPLLLILSATLSAFAGAYLGGLFLKKITIKVIQWIVSGMLIVFSIMLITGII